MEHSHVIFMGAGFILGLMVAAFFIFLGIATVDCGALGQKDGE